MVGALVLPPDDGRHYRRIGDSQTRQPVNSQLTIDHRHAIHAHGAGAGGMHGGADVGAQPARRSAHRSGLSGPGTSSAATSSEAGAVAKKRRTNLTMSRRPSRSASACSRLSWIRGLVARIGRAQRHLAAALRMQQHAGIGRSRCPAPLRQPGNHGRAKIDTGATSICRSGRSRCGAVRTRPCAEIGERARMPLRNIFHCSTDKRQPVEPQLAVETELTAGGEVDAQSTGDPGDSHRRRAGHAAPRCRAARDRAGAPMPESCSSCGELNVPAHRITSRSQRSSSILAADLALARRRSGRCSSSSSCASVLMRTCEIGARHRRPQEARHGAGALAGVDSCSPAPRTLRCPRRGNPRDV